MKVTLFTTTPELLRPLRAALQAEGHEVLQERTRGAAEPLAPLLSASGGDLLLVEAGSDPRQDVAALGHFADGHPRVALGLLAPRPDADLLLAAMRAGIREVLGSPPSAGELSAALRRLAHRAAAAPAARTTHQGKVIAFIACKGGSGATFIATNVAWLLAEELGRPTALLDLDLQYGDAASFVADTTARATLADVARQADQLDADLLEASMLHLTPRLSMLPAPEEPDRALAITPEQLERVVRVAREHLDFVLLDVERQLDAVAIKALDLADVVVLVTQNMVPHLRDARRLVRVLRSLGYADDKLRLVVNHYRKHDPIELQQAERATGLKVARTLPESHEEVAEAVNGGEPIARVHPHHAVTRGLREMAAELAGQPATASRGWIGRLIRETA